MKMRTSALISTRHDWYLVRDELKEQSERLRNRNRELLERQDYEITNATFLVNENATNPNYPFVNDVNKGSIDPITAFLTGKNQNKKNKNK